MRLVAGKVLRKPAWGLICQSSQIETWIIQNILAVPQILSLYIKLSNVIFLLEVPRI